MWITAVRKVIITNSSFCFLLTCYISNIFCCSFKVPRYFMFSRILRPCVHLCQYMPTFWVQDSLMWHLSAMELSTLGVMLRTVALVCECSVFHTSHCLVLRAVFHISISHLLLMWLIKALQPALGIVDRHV